MKTSTRYIAVLQIVLLVMFTTITFGCWNMPQDGKPSMNTVKEERSVRNFSALDIGGAFQVYLTQGNEEKLIVEAEQEDMEDIITEVVGNKLKIYTESGWHGNFHDMTIYLTFKQLDDIGFSGAVEVESQMPLTFDGLDLDVSGAAEISMEFNAASLDAEFSGASEVEFRGHVRKGISNCQARRNLMRKICNSPIWSSN